MSPSTSPGVPAVVLIGCGAVSRLFYSPSLRTLENAGVLRVHALVDPVAEARQTLQATFPGAQSHATIDDVPTAGGVDTLVIVASPPRLHLAHARAAFARGWHVLCEKPMAGNSAECVEMQQAAIASGQVLAVGHYKRFFPSSLTLKQLCSGTTPLGRLRSIHIHEGGPFNWPAASSSFFDRRLTPGGVLLDIGVHIFDLLLWWLGDPHDIQHHDDAMGGLETNTLTRLRFAPPAGPVEARIQLSRDWPTPQRYRFDFAGGKVEWKVNDANGLRVEIQGVSHPLVATLMGPEKGTDPAWSNPRSFIGQLEHVIDCIRRRTPVLVDGQEGARALRLIETCYARRQPLAQPWLAPDEQIKAASLASAI